MPAKPTWLLRTPEILEQLRASNVPFVDRDTIEKLFRLRRRRAIDLMRLFGGYQVGKTFLVDKGQILHALEALSHSEEFSYESRRKARLIESVEQARKEFSARQIPIPAPRQVAERSIPDLPAAIRLGPGELRIEFDGAQDLLRNLLELSQAIMNDYARFEELVGTDGQGMAAGGPA